MANRKISDLTALTAPVTGDLLPIVDISEAAAADKNKKITYGTFLSSVPLGTAAAPSIAFTGDINTGIYSPGADQIAISIGGTVKTTVDSSGRLLLGTSSSSVNTSLVLNGSSGGAGNPGIAYLQRNEPTPVLGSVLGQIYFANNAGNAAALVTAERDGGTWTSGSSHPGCLVFYTTADGAASPTEAMRIKSTGIINFSNAPTYADNTAATVGGLAVGDVYKTVLGVLMIRF